jgi:hypothetical protein
MLSNKILPDESRAGNENRAHVGRAGRYQQMMPMPGDCGVACSVRGAGPNDLPPPLRGDAPMTLDPHAAGRHSFDNLAVKPGERPRTQRAKVAAKTAAKAAAKAAKRRAPAQARAA